MDGARVAMARDRGIVDGGFDGVARKRSQMIFGACQRLKVAVGMR
jgi:hypothetical protein